MGDDAVTPQPVEPVGGFGLSNNIIGWIRTQVPVGVGLVAAYLFRRWGIVIDEQTKAGATLLVGGLAVTLYYTVARFLERRWPAFGVLLGVAKQPAYSPAPAPEAEPVVVPLPVADLAPAAPAEDGDSSALVGPVPIVNGRLGRLPQFDARNADFPIRAVLDPKAKPRSYTWGCNVVLDQGQEGSCVGHGVAHELAAKPVVVGGIDHAFALDLYHRAQVIDEYPGEAYSGTSVLAGMKAAAERGFFPEYRWAFDLTDVVLALGHHGPVVFGVDWWTGMFEPDDHGFLNVTGQVEGGHCILGRGVRLVKATSTTVNRGTGALAGYDLDRSYVLLLNSWGPEWGDDGNAKLRLIDLDRLLKTGGECSIPVRRSAA